MQGGKKSSPGAESLFCADEKATRRRHGAFSLLEVLVVVAIGMIVSVITLPLMTGVIANSKMRASMTSVSALIQNSRSVAVKQNRTTTARHVSRTVLPFGLVYYIKTATDSSLLSLTDSQVDLEAPIDSYTVPAGVGAPAAISTTALTFTPATGDPSFNSRGLPCAYSAGACPISGFITYFKDSRTGSIGWAAVSVSPAGRVKRWFWSGSDWGN